ncbi:diacylglycerol kinase family lipid kinase [Massilia sp. PAMC28688]|uniref:diacylglycerol/lipid kinase family protein n=1 Tax=Massilia sp. PAMC28688 TaxID=2861283 RepID=UPI001C63130F|nr:diacylglycerol kinase family protein [Massilia sp. PAMC28688]QYF96239.1 diacylglycerol kinase family lipid kinase [Massilia sp. PAMC28688]
MRRRRAGHREKCLTRIAVIINGSAGAGHGQDQAASLRLKFAAHALEADVTLAADGEAIIAATRRAVVQRLPVVVAGGGDGTINAVASVLADHPHIAFGVLPLGTLNHFAKDAGIPLDLDEAIATIARGARRRVDLGEVNGRIFLNNSSLGLYPDIVREREKQQHRLGRGKWLAACWATLRALKRYPFLNVSLRLDDGADHVRSTPFVFVGNNEYSMQGFNLGARARLDGGRLSLCMAQRPGRLALLRLGWCALRGRLAQEGDFDMLQARSMEIETRERRVRVATDGEVTVMHSPLRYRIRPGALNVIVPM